MDYNLRCLHLLKERKHENVHIEEDTAQNRTVIFGLYRLYLAGFAGRAAGGVAWPSIRREFTLPLDSLGLLLVAATAGYLTSSFFSGKVMARLGVGGGGQDGREDAEKMQAGYC